MNFNSHTDAIVLTTVALVNVATPGAGQGRPYAVPTGRDLVARVNAALRAGDRRVRRLDAEGVAALLPAVAELRGVFVAMAAGQPDRAARAVNALLDRTHPTPHLDRHDGEPWHLHFHSRTDDPPISWAGSCAVALATVVGSEHADRLGVCAAPPCDRVYVDVSRNGTRRFCSTACQNRVKAATHRARRAG